MVSAFLLLSGSETSNVRLIITQLERASIDTHAGCVFA